MKTYFLTFLISLSVVSSLPALKDKFIKVCFPDGTSITAELAVTDEERQQGLMFRERLSSDQGMLFVFEEEGIYSFWMLNTKISLDILWLDKERRIIHVERHASPCPEMPCPSYSPKSPTMYVLELRAGSFDDRKLKLSDRLEFVLPLL